ncbi:hypothetical protein DNTS_003794 [Danionella cerebrum]|uniref:HECT domain-containing protein n=1 Tax=Danionella cerebrum TaxID=2873325 RepID=A0A553N421_9TELE|nr:hypothetical protein DNTS_003794 [Danionella translucida]
MENDRMCGSRCLGPMTFNAELKGRSVTLTQGRRFASRDVSTFQNGLAFLSRPVKVDEKMNVLIEKCTSSWDGALRVGFSNICPQRNHLPTSSIPYLRDTHGYCVVPVPDDLCKCGTELNFWINYAGMVIVHENGGEKYYLKAKGLNLNSPLWVFIDLFGSTSAVRLLGIPDHEARSVDPSWDLPELNRFICSMYPLVNLDAGFHFTKADKHGKLCRLNGNTVKKLKKDLGDNVLYIVPETDIEQNGSPSSFMDADVFSQPHTSTATPAQRRQRLASTSPALNSSVEDICSLLRNFQQVHLSSTEHISIVISRKKLLQMVKNALSNCNFPWTKIPLVTFVGEEAIDCGGPQREFFRILMVNAQSLLGIFEGQPGHLFFTYDQMALEERIYELAGKMIAWSVIHGGPGLKALDPSLYQLMCTQECNLQDFDWHLMPDANIQENLQKILSCKTHADFLRLQRELGDWICDCGFLGIYRPEISIKDLPKIYSCVVRHHIYLRPSNMIHQFTKGLNAYGQLWELVRSHWHEFLPIFTHKHEPLTRSTFRALFEIHWSKMGSKRADEERTIYLWELVLDLIEDKGKNSPKKALRFEEILAFVTGADEVPPLGFPQKPSIQFYQPEPRGCRLPYANTCMMGLFLPRVVQDEEELYRMLLRAIRDSAACFGRT